MASQGTLLRERHDSRHKTRLKKYDKGGVNPERLYLATWKHFARQVRGHSGATLLEHILAKDLERPEPVSRHDAAIVATFVQWLGTNVGLGFIRRAEQAIDDARERSEAARKRGNRIRDEEARLVKWRAALEAAEKQLRERGQREIEV